MKKLLFVAAFAVLGLSGANAQEGFSAGAHVGTTTGDFSDFYSLNYGVDVSYMFNVAESLDVGFASGVSIYGGEDITILGVTIAADDATFIPLAGAARYSFSESFFGGVDLGYAVNTDNGGGLYYQPKAGWKNEKIDVFAFYKGISDDGASLNSVGAGVAFKF